MTTSILTLLVKVLLWLIELYLYMIDWRKEAKWFVIIPIESVLQCTNGLSSNHG